MTDAVPGSSISHLKLANLGDNNEAWVPILEKAFAKISGQYSHTDSGYFGEAMAALTGAPGV